MRRFVGLQEETFAGANDLILRDSRLIIVEARCLTVEGYIAHHNLNGILTCSLYQ